MVQFIAIVLVGWLLIAAMCQGPASQDMIHAGVQQQLANERWHELEKRLEKTR